MPQRSYEMELDFFELWTLLFRKKICARCGSRLERRSSQTASGPRWQREGSWTRWSFWYGDRIKVKLLYDCAACRLTYSLSQLRFGLPGEPTEAPDDTKVD